MDPKIPARAEAKTETPPLVVAGIDLHFGRFLCRLSKKNDESVFLAACLVSKALREGHVCLDLASVADATVQVEGEHAAKKLPALAAWVEALERSGVVGSKSEFRPLILFENRLYTQRFWDYERRLVSSLQARLALDFKIDNTKQLEDALSAVFPSEEPGGLHRQKLAAISAVFNGFTVISGGPGTGKTATVARILVLLLMLTKANLRIALAAPTGKAAARLKKAVADTVALIRCPAVVKAAIPQDAFTIHRLLGAQPQSPYFRHSSENPLPFDVVIVDEASMVDFSLMTKLITAVPVSSRVILLGDRDQLASVEAGAVLGDVCDTGRVHAMTPAFCKRLEPYLPGIPLPVDSSEPKLSDSIIQLKKSFRFPEHSGIARLAACVNAGEDGDAMSLFTDASLGDIAWKDLPGPHDLAAAMAGPALLHFGAYLAEPDFPKAFERFESFRILCAVRNGPCGVTAVNGMIERILYAAGLIRSDSAWYVGRPIMISVNDYSLDLYNGDVGIVMPDPDNPNRRVACFFAGDGRTIRRFVPQRLPPHETVFAATVHKAQGSEYGRVLLLLPPADLPLVSRELVYTGITRAKKSVEVWANRDAFSKAILRRVVRMSGLREALWGK